jgi:tripartite-type tricarboxylate transporter receptor subunit TctC
MIRRIRCVATLAIALCIAAPAIAAYPEKTVRIVVGFAAGGPTDIVARLAAEKLSQLNGQPFIVDNKPGAAAMIAAAEVARAPADGYTLLMTGTNHATSPAVLPKIQYELKDFVAVYLVAEGPHVLVVNGSSPFNSVKDVVAAAKAKPKEITYSSSGRGGTVHFAGAMFEEAAGVELTHVPYKGAAPAVQDLIGGQVQMSFASLASVSAYLRAGKLKMLAVAAPARVADFPTGADIRGSRLSVGDHLGVGRIAGAGEDAEARAGKAGVAIAAGRRNARRAPEAADAGHDARIGGLDRFRQADRRRSVAVRTHREAAFHSRRRVIHL